ncbi:uncharacterized protein LOC111100916 isoform X2 [Crassostrea virginica]
MKQPSLSVVFLIYCLGFGRPCSEELGVIDNAFLKCSTNESCAAKCYPGYVFFNGETKREYICNDGVWHPNPTSACKRVPVLYIEYAAIWKFQIIPYTCANMIIRLNNSENTLEEEFSKECKKLIKNFTVHFTFETLAFSVTTVFSTEYINYTKSTLDTCSSVLNLGFQNLDISKVFDNITCENETANYELDGRLQIRDKYVTCPKGMELKNVSRNESVSQTIKHYCEYQVTNLVTNDSKRTTAQLTPDMPDTTITDSQETKDTNSITTIDATNDQVTNEGNGTTLRQTVISEIITFSTTFDKNGERNVSYPVENNYDKVTDRFTTDVQAEVYIGASAGGVVFITLVVIIAVVCRKKRTRRPGGHLKALEMDVCNNSDDSFKGELIENTLYQSADGFDNKGASMHPSISDKPYIPLANSTGTLEPDLNTGEDHPSNQTNETKLSNCINKNMDNDSKSAPIVDNSRKPRHVLNPGDEYSMIRKSDKNT